VVIYLFKDVDVHKYNQHLLFLNELLEMMENKEEEEKMK
jgi:hypothetical protein